MVNALPHMLLFQSVVVSVAHTGYTDTSSDYWCRASIVVMVHCSNHTWLPCSELMAIGPIQDSIDEASSSVSFCEHTTWQDLHASDIEARNSRPTDPDFQFDRTRLAQLE